MRRTARLRPGRVPEGLASRGPASRGPASKGPASKGLAAACLAAFLAAWPGAARADEAAWAALRADGAVAILRHARAPGGGDPPGFRLGDCTTQRNLADEGRAQARRIGAAFRARGVAVGRVLSSRWCRALETARLAFGEATREEPTLDSFFSDQAAAEPQTRAVREILAGWRGSGALVLVTHQVNVTALTGAVPAEGEVLVLRPGPGGAAVVGRLVP
ncbi:hypothetical protein OPKNFCMD_1278 [Methylobacterium crusticola]|uniref:Histidine phosphatase family protein n=1 Tax=Methylobacterium crusticola TaxID=1697972 RepID=A0ABQ4QTA3_9HYPH|nr:histidine phosphatase family protein [Methylobacterium crusticola]GJD48556.1 hypothetical protein OPKNFCMD_1278 [Methylobacterium crusticola]